MFALRLKDFFGTEYWRELLRQKYSEYFNYRQFL